VQSQACADFGLQVTPEGILRGYAAADAYMSEQTALRPLRLRDPEEREAFFAEYELLVLRGNGIEVSRAQALDIWRGLREIPYAMVAFDDVVPALRRLKQMGLTLGLISNIDRDGGELAESLGLASYLDLTVTSGEVGAEKPDPAIFQAALARACAQPSEAIHVGDQPSADVEGARGAGIGPVLLDRDGNHKRFDRCPRIESLLELPGLLRDWGAE
jgi:HAD superfamily hydrolase (TIGR01549 family)